MSLPSMIKSIMSIVLYLGLLELSGCANSVAQYYTKIDSQKIINAADPNTCIKPQVISTTHLHTRLQNAIRNKWVQVGYSAWNGPSEDVIDEATKQAKQINACLVLISQAQSGVETEEMPMYGGGYFGSYYGGYPYYGFPAYAPYTVSIYNIKVLFFKQMQIFSTGLYVMELANSSRKIVGSNKGVEVIQVVNNSPAYDANIIPGDIITQVGQTQLSDYASYKNAVNQYSGDKALFVINRGGKLLKKHVDIIDLSQ